MLKPEINDLLTQTGPGTAMGALFREYWIPALLAEELPENDCPPVRAKVRLTAYPLVKVGDILWTHLGDPARRPGLPEFEFVQVPAEQTYTSKRWQESNWLQAFEGGIDSSHVSWLHSGGLRNDPLFKGSKGNDYNMRDFRPFFEVADAEGGLFVG